MPIRQGNGASVAKDRKGEWHVAVEITVFGKHTFIYTPYNFCIISEISLEGMLKDKGIKISNW